MSYEIPAKIRALTAYDPSEGTFQAKLDANESYFSLPEDIRAKICDAVAGIDFNRYPDPMAAELCRAAADFYGVGQEEIVAGNGSDELISVIISAYGANGSVLISEPDFSMYRFYSEIFDIRCVPTDKTDRKPDIDALIQAANINKASVVVFSNPCNPSGQGIDREEVLRLIDSVSCLVVVDEAYMDFWDQSIIGELKRTDHVIVLKTASKAAGLAAVRLGFALGAGPLIDGIKKVKSPFNVNSLTQAVGRIVLGEREYLRSCREAIAASCQELYCKVKSLADEYPEQLQALPTMTNFVLIQCWDADIIQQKLLNRSVCVRRSFGDCLRVTAGSQTENELFLTELRKICEEASQ